MKATRERNELASKIHQHGDKDTLKMVSELMLWDMEDIREENDMCETEQWLQNKGAIRELKKLVKSLSGIDIATVVKG